MKLISEIQFFKSQGRVPLKTKTASHHNYQSHLVLSLSQWTRACPWKSFQKCEHWSSPEASSCMEHKPISQHPPSCSTMRQSGGTAYWPPAHYTARGLQRAADKGCLFLTWCYNLIYNLHDINASSLSHTSISPINAQLSPAQKGWDPLTTWTCYEMTHPGFIMPISFLGIGVRRKWLTERCQPPMPLWWYCHRFLLRTCCWFVMFFFDTELDLIIMITISSVEKYQLWVFIF